MIAEVGEMHLIADAPVRLSATTVNALPVAVTAVQNIAEAKKRKLFADALCASATNALKLAI
jgi:hypothetical protein